LDKGKVRIERLHSKISSYKQGVMHTSHNCAALKAMPSLLYHSMPYHSFLWWHY
jgi:hypothetical protein